MKQTENLRRKLSLLENDLEAGTDARNVADRAMDVVNAAAALYWNLTKELRQA